MPRARTDDFQWPASDLGRIQSEVECALALGEPLPGRSLERLQLRLVVGCGGGLCADGEDQVGGDRGADRVVVTAGFSPHRASRFGPARISLAALAPGMTVHLDGTPTGATMEVPAGRHRITLGSRTDER